MNATSMMAFVAKSNALEDGVKRFLEDVERREKSIEASVEYAWQEIGKKDANNAILEHYSKDIHDYAVILNELTNVKRELHKILEGAE